MSLWLSGIRGAMYTLLDMFVEYPHYIVAPADDILISIVFVVMRREADQINASIPIKMHTAEDHLLLRIPCFHTPAEMSVYKKSIFSNVPDEAFRG